MDTNEIKDRFWQYLMEHHGGSARQTNINLKAAALFDAIQDAFDVFSPANRCGVDLRWMTDPDMVGMMAACASVALTYNKNDQINWDAHDYVLARTFRGFVSTLVVAIRRGGVKKIEGHTYLRSFSIPEWFIEWANGLYDEVEFYLLPEEFLKVHEAELQMLK